jgi:hypothetical protein
MYRDDPNIRLFIIEDDRTLYPFSQTRFEIGKIVDTVLGCGWFAEKKSPTIYDFPYSFYDDLSIPRTARQDYFFTLPLEEGIEKLISKTVQNRIDKWAQGLPEDYAQFLEYVQSGGNPKDFVNVYYGNHSWEEFDLESEDNQKLAIKESLRLVGESEEDIQDMVDEWEINGTLEKRAKSAITKLQKHEKAQKEEIVKIQKENAEKQKQAQLEYWNNFKKELYDKDEIAGFKLTPKVKDKLWDFMTAADKRTGKTPYQQAIENNKDSSYLFAYLAMNNFNAEKLEEKVQTKVSNNMSKMLKNYTKDTKNKIRGGSTDDNYDSDPFAAFKQIK